MFQTSSSAIQRYNTNSIFSPKDSVPDSLKSRVCTSLFVQAVECVI